MVEYGRAIWLITKASESVRRIGEVGKGERSRNVQQTEAHHYEVSKVLTYFVVEDGFCSVSRVEE